MAAMHQDVVRAQNASEKTQAFNLLLFDIQRNVPINSYGHIGPACEKCFKI